MAVTFDVSDVALGKLPRSEHWQPLDAGAALMKLTAPPGGMQPLPKGTPLDRKKHVVTLADMEGTDETLSAAMPRARHIGGRGCDVPLHIRGLEDVRIHLVDRADGLWVTSVEGEAIVRVHQRTWPRDGSPWTPSDAPALLTHGSVLELGDFCRLTVNGAVPAGTPHLETSGSSLVTGRGAGVGAGAQILPAHNGFMSALYVSFDSHLPLALSPDHVWLVLAQGFATHVKQNAEALRARFVPFEGKQNLVVRRDAQFTPGNADNDWSGVVDELARVLGDHIGEARKRLVVCDFSTTTNVERIASSITLLDAMSPFFTYELMTLCGIPRITLLGTAEDWRDVHRRARALCEFVDGWWSELGPALANFVNAASGNVDVDVWRSFYKYDDRSGGAWVTGWVNALFPYAEPSAGILKRRDVSEDSVKHGQHPWAISSAPLLWSGPDRETLPMRLLSGMPGISMVDGALQPAVAWAVLRDN